MASSLSCPSKQQLRSDDDVIFLVGKCESDLKGAKLPSMRQVLQLFFYKTRVEKISVKDSIKYTINCTLAFWLKANIPTMTEVNCVKKFHKLFKDWKDLSKNRYGQYEKYRKDEKEFSEKIGNYIFDIAAPDALKIMKIQEDKDFLLQQRQRGRPGSMCGFDVKLARKEKKKAKRVEEQETRKRKYLDDVNAQGKSTTQYSVFSKLCVQKILIYQYNCIKFE